MYVMATFKQTFPYVKRAITVLQTLPAINHESHVREIRTVHSRVINLIQRLLEDSLRTSFCLWNIKT